MTYLLIGFILFNNVPYMKINKPMVDFETCQRFGKKIQREVPLIEKGNTVVWACVNVAEKGV